MERPTNDLDLHLNLTLTLTLTPGVTWISVSGAAVSSTPSAQLQDIHHDLGLFVDHSAYYALIVVAESNR